MKPTSTTKNRSVARGSMQQMTLINSTETESRDKIPGSCSKQSSKRKKGLSSDTTPNHKKKKQENTLDNFLLKCAPSSEYAQGSESNVHTSPDIVSKIEDQAELVDQEGILMPHLESNIKISTLKPRSTKNDLPPSSVKHPKQLDESKMNESAPPKKNKPPMEISCHKKRLRLLEHDSVLRPLIVEVAKDVDTIMYALNIMIVSDTYLRAFEKVDIPHPIPTEGFKVQDKFSHWYMYIQKIATKSIDELKQFGNKQLNSEKKGRSKKVTWKDAETGEEVHDTVKYIDKFFFEKTLPFVHKTLHDLNFFKTYKYPKNNMSQLKFAPIRQYSTNYVLHQTSGGFLSRCIKFLSVKIGMSKKKARKVLAYVYSDNIYRTRFRQSTKEWVISDFDDKTSFQELYTKVNGIVREYFQNVNPFRVDFDQVHICAQISATMHLQIIELTSQNNSEHADSNKYENVTKVVSESSSNDKSSGFVAVPVMSNKLQFLSIPKKDMGNLFKRMLDHEKNKDNRTDIMNALMNGSGLSDIKEFQKLHKNEMLLKNACKLLNISTKF